MITVYYGRADRLVEKIGFDKCLTHIEERRKEKVLRTGDKLSQVRSLATGELLHLAMCRYLNGVCSKAEHALVKEGSENELRSDLADRNQPFDTVVLPGGKPCFKRYPKVHFNLSHSADYVCCAIGDEPIGVDIQKHVPVREGLAKRFFTESENRMLESLDTEEREKLFFRMWSIKESFIKFTGEGMKQGMDTFEIDWNNSYVYLRDADNLPLSSLEQHVREAKQEKIQIQAYFEEFFAVEGYSLSVCRENSETEILWCNIDDV